VITNHAVASSTWFWDVFVHKTRALQLRREAQFKPQLRVPPPCWATGTISTVVEHNLPIWNTRVRYLREAQTTTCPCSYCHRYRLSRPSRAPVLRSSWPFRERRGKRGLQRARKWRPPWFMPLWGIGKESYVPQRKLQKPSPSFCLSGNATAIRFWWTRPFWIRNDQCIKKTFLQLVILRPLKKSLYYDSHLYVPPNEVSRISKIEELRSKQSAEAGTETSQLGPAVREETCKV